MELPAGFIILLAVTAAQPAAGLAALLAAFPAHAQECKPADVPVKCAEGTSGTGVYCYFKDGSIVRQTGEDCTSCSRSCVLSPRAPSIRDQWMQTHDPHGVKVRPPLCEIAVVKAVYPAAPECVRGEFGPPSRPQDGDYHGCAGAGAGGISYTNGKYQNGSYNYVPAMEDSKPGDRVWLCLVERPVDCPPGDARGWVYDATNLRTHGHWRKPDAEHGCGGA
jgi:hypothetical protein